MNSVHLHPFKRENAAYHNLRLRPIAWVSRHRAHAPRGLALRGHVIIRTMFGLNGRQIFILLVLILTLGACTQYLPGYFAALQFSDYARQEVKYAASARKTPEAVRDEIVEKATELGIPLSKKEVHITRRGPAFNVFIEYHWPINLRVYSYEMTFHVDESGEVFENASN